MSEISRNQGVLFLRNVNGEPKWFEDDDEDNDGKYFGEIENGVKWTPSQGQFLRYARNWGYIEY